MAAWPAPCSRSPPWALTWVAVERALREAVVTDDPFLTEVASHLILAGGKRLRPALAIAVAAAVSADAAPAVATTWSWAASSVELVHLGSLYHDDVMDEADTRRGVESVNARWGNLQAILAGDFLLARASEIAASLGTEVAGLLAAHHRPAVRGRDRELQTHVRRDRTEATTSPRSRARRRRCSRPPPASARSSPGSTGAASTR